MIKYEVFVALSLTIFQPQNLQELQVDIDIILTLFCTSRSVS